MFPVIRSLLHPQALALAIEKAYPMRGVQCELIKAQVADTYRVRSLSGEAILREYRHGWRTPGQIRAELDVLMHLYLFGVRVSYPITTENGDFLLPFAAPEGERFGVLFTMALGEPLSANRTEAALFAYGAEAAKVHEATDSLPPTIDRPALDLDFLLEKPLAAIDRRLPADAPFFREAADALRLALANLPLDGLCHGDLDSSNVFMDDGAPTLFDFDYCGPGWRLYDLAAFLTEVQLWNWPRPPAMTDAFLAGYASIRPLPDLSTLKAMQAVRSLWVLGTHAANIDHWGNFRLSTRMVAHIRRDVGRLLSDGAG